LANLISLLVAFVALIALMIATLNTNVRPTWFCRVGILFQFARRLDFVSDRGFDYWAHWHPDDAVAS